MSHNLFSAGFMSQPADLAQQLEAQREIAIREISNSTQTRHSNSPEPENEPENEPEPQVEAEIHENCPEQNQNLENQELPTFPLFDSCFDALDLTNRLVILLINNTSITSLYTRLFSS